MEFHFLRTDILLRAKFYLLMTTRLFGDLSINLILIPMNADAAWGRLLPGR